MFRDLVLAASSPANDSVPEERRVVDRDAMRNMCDVVVKPRGSERAGDTASALGATPTLRFRNIFLLICECETEWSLVRLIRNRS